MKKIQIYLFACLAFVLFSATTCDPAYHQFVRLENLSDDSIVVVWEEWPFDSLYAFGQYQVCKDIVASKEYYNKIDVTDPRGSDQWSDDLYLGIAKSSRLKETPLDSIIKYRLWDRFYHFKFCDLEAMRFRIVYTGE